MKTEKEKLYYEKRAQLTLIHRFCPNIYSPQIRLQDCPDLYDFINDIGIEVTRAFYENNAEISSIGRECMNLPVEQLDSKKESYINKLGGKLLKVENKVYGITYRANWISSSELEKCYNAKIEKLNKGHYKNCKSYDLYIFSPGFEEYDDNHIEQFMKTVNKTKENYQQKFRYIIIDDLYYIYLCDFNNNNYKKYTMPRNIVSDICVASKKHLNSNVCN